MFKNYKKLAFTLAELLVCIGVIGSIAAMTIPSLAYNYRAKVLEEQYRSTYSDLRQIGAMLNYEKGDVGVYANSSNFADWERAFVAMLNGGNSVKTGLTPVTLQTEYTSLYREGGASPGPWMFNLNKGGLVKTINICDNGGIWLDTKGRIWTFNAENRIICVDVNGVSNPNRLNMDIHAFIPMTSKMVATWVYDDPTNPLDYSGTIIPCDLDKITHKGLSNKVPGRNGVAFAKGSGSALDTCPFNEPVENIAAMNSTQPGKSAKGRTVTTSDTYWKSYIDYK